MLKKMLLKLKTTPEILVIQGDITQQGCECVVNAANKQLQPGGGVCGAIYDAAGDELIEDPALSKPIKTGGAVVSYGYKLSKYIIHAVGPIYNPKKSLFIQNEKLAKSYISALNLASKYKVEEIAFPLISTGIYKYPKIEAVSVALDTITNWKILHPLTSVKKIKIVCFSNEDYVITNEYYKAIFNV